MASPLGAGAGRAPWAAIGWTRGGQRLRSNYVVLYRYRDGRIGQQELYYDPSGQLETLGSAAV